jgi:gliding motility-associated-like protein
MKRPYRLFYPCLLSLSCFIILCTGIYTPLAAQGWVNNTDLFNDKVFIENKGQYTGENNSNDVLFAIRQSGVVAYFSPSGLTYRHDEVKELSEEDREQMERATHKGGAAGGDEEKLKTISHFVNMQWIGANADVQIIGENMRNDYFTFPDLTDKSGKSCVKAPAYRKIIYKNLYPGIDVEYVFPENKEGIKYSFILHPGADASLIKMRYDSKIKTDEEGNILINTAFGTITDHAPVTFYADTKQSIPSSFLKISSDKKNSEIAFTLSDYDKTKTIIIDPFTSIPVFTGGGNAYDVDYDLAGNAYVYGGSYPWQAKKFNNAGALQWTYTASLFYNTGCTGGACYGDFAVDGNSGSSYLVEGYYGGIATRVIKLNAAGTQLGVFPGNPNLGEMWRIVFNNTTKKGVIAGGGVSTPYQTCMLDTNVTSMTPINTLAANEVYHDIALLTMDNTSAYMGTARSSVNAANYDNIILKVPVTALAPTAYQVPDGHNFLEIGSITYTNTNGLNGMAVNCFLYTYDGATLKKWNKNTGAAMGSVVVNAASTFQTGGLAVDSCDNIYLGNQTTIKKYDSNLSFVSNIATTTGTIFDVKLDLINNRLYASGVGFVTEVNITPPPPSTYSKSSTPASCLPDGTATVAVSVCGGAPYTYQWMPGGQTTATATNLAPGTYTITVNYANCKPPTIDTVQISGTGITPAIAVTSKSICEGGTTTLTATPSATGGIYSWAPGGATTQTITVNPIATTTYTVTYTFSGCAGTGTGVVTVIPTPVVTVNSPIICAGQTAAFTASGGTTYTWSAGITSTGVNTATAAPVVSTTYTVTGITSGCMGTVTTSVTVNPIPAITVNSPVICPGTLDTLMANGATTYSWSAGATSSGGNKATVSPTITTTYTVTGTAGGCSASTKAIVTVVTAPLTNAGIDDTICFGGSANLNASPSGGAYTYLWAPATGLSNTTINNPIASPTVTTTYTVTITNTTGCSATDAVKITVDPQLGLSVAGIDATCNGACNGQTIVIPNGGTAPYSYNWSSGCTSAACNNICAGTYTITITDVLGCIIVGDTIISEPPPVIASISGFTPASCNGVCDGTATVSVNGGSAPYTYSWNTVPVQTTSMPLGCCDGSYTCIATDANGCTSTASVVITEPTPVVLSPVTPATICIGASTTLTTSASGGNGGYNYTWMPTGETTTSITVSPTVTSTYTVTASDASGCTALPKTVVITVNPALTVIATGAISICPGGSATLTATPNGGNGGPYTYAWAPAGSGTSATTVSPAVSTTYTVTVSDGCGTPPATDTVTVIVLPVPTVAFSANVTSGCAALCVNFTDSSIVAAGSTIVTWAWNFGDGTTSTIPNPTHCFSGPGKYSITLTVQTNGGCSATFTNTSMITVFADPVAEFNATPNPTDVLDPNVTMNNLSTPDVNYWFWTFGDGDSLSPNVSSPLHKYSDSTEKTYTTTLIVRNANGCVDTVSHNIVIGPQFTFYIPNAFTPNGDGMNDLFFGMGIGIVKYEMFIFDRWGNMIYHANSLKEQWDGKANYGKDIAQQDVYVWKVSLTDVFHKKHNYIGTVTLVK